MVKALPFMAFGRVKDAITLATLSLQGDDASAEERRVKTEEIFKKLLAAAAQKLKPGQRTRLQWNDGSVCCLMDATGEYLYCVVNSFMEYPEYYAYELLREFMGEVQKVPGLKEASENGLTESLKPLMMKLMEKYEDPNTVMGLTRHSGSLAPGGDEARSLIGNEQAPQGVCPCCSVM
eukprot:TRINITY_DN30013_c0_g1_i1.p1 TRINITY_DN30013_c0_g1~~TRINITY_DN30013_c0_g1_i1.p1  ORF type:complete len:178 (-),score=52.90 TRINITY_DN30013_c0_g1_i1:75-608(-)